MLNIDPIQDPNSGISEFFRFALGNGVANHAVSASEESNDSPLKSFSSSEHAVEVKCTVNAQCHRGYAGSFCKEGINRWRRLCVNVYCMVLSVSAKTIKVKQEADVGQKSVL